MNRLLEDFPDACVKNYRPFVLIDMFFLSRKYENEFPFDCIREWSKVNQLSFQITVHLALMCYLVCH